jgi:hypothetical protein
MKIYKLYYDFLMMTTTLYIPTVSGGIRYTVNVDEYVVQNGIIAKTTQQQQHTTHTTTLLIFFSF